MEGENVIDLFAVAVKGLAAVATIHRTVQFDVCACEIRGHRERDVEVGKSEEHRRSAGRLRRGLHDLMSRMWKCVAPMISAVALTPNNTLNDSPICGSGSGFMNTMSQTRK